VRLLAKTSAPGQGRGLGAGDCVIVHV
jgi:hypothetical protein